MSKDYENAVDELMKDMKDLRADMKGVVSALHGKAGKYVDDVREAIHESVHPHGKREGENMSRDYDKAVDELMKDVHDLRADLKSVISALHGKAGNYVESAKESLVETIAHRPFACLLATLGAGVLLGGLLRGGRR